MTVASSVSSSCWYVVTPIGPGGLDPCRKCSASTSAGKWRPYRTSIQGKRCVLIPVHVNTKQRTHEHPYVVATWNMMSVQWVQKWCCGFADGHEIIVEEDRSGHMLTWNTFVSYVDEMLEVDRHVTETVTAGIWTVLFGTCRRTTRMRQCLQQIGFQSKCPTKKEDWQSEHLTNQPTVLQSWRWWLFLTCSWRQDMGTSPRSRGQRWNPRYTGIQHRLKQRSLRQLWAWGKPHGVTVTAVWPIRPCYNALSSSTPEAQPAYPSTSRAWEISYTDKCLNKFSGPGVQI